MQILETIIQFLTENYGTMLVVLGVIFAVAKRMSNEKAGPVVRKIQQGFDLVAQGAEVVGRIAKKISDLLADVLKSDGILGRK